MIKVICCYQKSVDLRNVNFNKVIKETYATETWNGGISVEMNTLYCIQVEL